MKRERKEEGLCGATRCSTTLDRWDARVRLRAERSSRGRRRKALRQKREGTRDAGKSLNFKWIRVGKTNQKWSYLWRTEHIVDYNIPNDNSSFKRSKVNLPNCMTYSHKVLCSCSGKAFCKVFHWCSALTEPVADTTVAMALQGFFWHQFFLLAILWQSEKMCNFLISLIE